MAIELGGSKKQSRGHSLYILIRRILHTDCFINVFWFRLHFKEIHIVDANEMSRVISLVKVIQSSYLWSHTQRQGLGLLTQGYCINVV